MAVYKLFPDKDNFIFTEVPQANAGYDEMIELGSYPVLEVGQTSRFLIHFSDTEIADVIDNKIESVNDLKHFSSDNYRFSEKLSTENELIFTR